MFGNAQMIETDLFASNGVIHVINSVILHSVGQTPKVVFNQPSKAVDSQPTKPPVNQQKTRVINLV